MDGAYVINLEDFESIETHWISLLIIENLTYVVAENPT